MHISVPKAPMRPEVGTQAQFKKKLPPQKYRYDDSLSPTLEWDGKNPARERGEAHIARAEQELTEVAKELAAAERPDAIEAAKTHLGAAEEAVRELRAMSKPFLNWAGKAERMSFEVPTLPLFIHERLSTKAILETLKGHKRDKQTDMFDLLGDPQHSITDQLLRAYEHKDKWVNRMILGDSLVVMNSLLRYEGLGGQVQMIYMDPPYGVSFGSNFQPFVRRKRCEAQRRRRHDTRTGDGASIQRHVGARAALISDLFTRSAASGAGILGATGSVFVQISDENLHYVRETLDRSLGRRISSPSLRFV